jgi:hypothetical protein
MHLQYLQLDPYLWSSLEICSRKDAAALQAFRHDHAISFLGCGLVVVLVEQREEPEQSDTYLLSKYENEVERR